MPLDPLKIARRLMSRGADDFLDALASRIRRNIDFELPDYPVVARTDLIVAEDAFERAVTEHIVEHWTRKEDVRSILPSAIVSVFSQLSEDGEHDGRTLEQTLSPLGLRCLQTIQATSPERHSAIDEEILKGGAPALADRLVGSVEFPQLAALEAVVRFVGKDGEFAEMTIDGIQHLFGSTGSLLESLFELGISRAGSALAGKNYSANAAVSKRLELEGVFVDGPQRLSFGSHESDQRDLIAEKIHRFRFLLPPEPRETDNPRFLVIDDGGELLAAIHEELPQYANYFIGVEQTRKGARRLRDLDLAFPVANVAECDLKLTYESPMIAESVVVETVRKLNQLEASGFHTGSKALVMGFGSVGRAVAERLLAEGREVHVYDPDPALRAAAAELGCTVHRDPTEALPHGDVVVSCVGKRTLFNFDLNYLPEGAVLVNAASGAEEFSPEILQHYTIPEYCIDENNGVWEEFQGRPFCTGRAGTNLAHRDVVAKSERGGQFIIVNGGHPVNFTGERDPIPPRFIQLTRALLLLGAITAKRATGVGLIDLPQEGQTFVQRIVERDLARTGDSLLHPKWEDEIPSLPVEVAPPWVVEELSGEPPPVLAPPGQGPIHGYTLGPVAPGSFEAWIDETVGRGDGVLDLFEAALHRAHGIVQRYTGVEFGVSIGPAPESNEPLQSAGTEYREGFAIESGAEESEQLERLAAAYVLTLIEGHHARGGTLDYDTIRAEARRAIRESSIDLELFEQVSAEWVDGRLKAKSG